MKDAFFVIAMITAQACIFGMGMWTQREIRQYYIDKKKGNFEGMTDEEQSLFCEAADLDDKANAKYKTEREREFAFERGAYYGFRIAMSRFLPMSREYKP
jgi:hypothetical protein